MTVGVYGQYGGRYVPETLIPALDELAMAWDQVRSDVQFPTGARGAAQDVRGTADAAHAR